MKATKRSKKTGVVVQDIPASSVLAPLQRKGIEGVCLACDKPIREHYGHRNTWLGCQATGLDVNTPFLLVPARRRADIRSVRSLVRKTGDRVVAGTLAAPQDRAKVRVSTGAKRGPGTVTPYVYKVKDRRKKVEGLTGARLDAFRVLTRHKTPLDVKTVAARSEHPKETTQQLLKWLVEHGYAARQPLVVKTA